MPYYKNAKWTPALALEKASNAVRKSSLRVNTMRFNLNDNRVPEAERGAYVTRLKKFEVVLHVDRLVLDATIVKYSNYPKGRKVFHYY